MITILGAEVAGLCTATVLAPFVEAESAPPEVARLGAGTADWWAARVRLEFAACQPYPDSDAAARVVARFYLSRPPGSVRLHRAA